MTKTLRDDDIIPAMRLHREAADELIRRREAEVARRERCRCGSRDLPTYVSRGVIYKRDRCYACRAQQFQQLRAQRRHPVTALNVERVIVRANRGTVTWYQGGAFKCVYYRKLKHAPNTPQAVVRFYMARGYQLIEKRPVGTHKEYQYVLERYSGARSCAA